MAAFVDGFCSLLGGREPHPDTHWAPTSQSEVPWTPLQQHWNLALELALPFYISGTLLTFFKVSILPDFLVSYQTLSQSCNPLPLSYSPRWGRRGIPSALSCQAVTTHPRISCCICILYLYRYWYLGTDATVDAAWSDRAKETNTRRLVCSSYWHKSTPYRLPYLDFWCQCASQVVLYLLGF